MDKKALSENQQKKETTEVAEKAANAGHLNRLLVHVGKKVGIVEWTKMDPGFEMNIGKVILYHNYIYTIVDVVEMQVQLNPALIEEKKVVSPDGENPWEMIGGWLHYMSLTQFEGHQSTILQKYSYACGKIAQKEIQMQKRTRSHLIRKMRLYTSDGSVELNANIAALSVLLEAIDRARHHVKSAPTNNELKIRGEELRKTIRAFNEKGYEVQGSIDEVNTIITLHMNELLKFFRELSAFHNSTYNTLTEVIHRLGYKVGVGAVGKK